VQLGILMQVMTAAEFLDPMVALTMRLNIACALSAPFNLVKLPTVTDPLTSEVISLTQGNEDCPEADLWPMCSSPYWPAGYIAGLQASWGVPATYAPTAGRRRLQGENSSVQVNSVVVFPPSEGSEDAAAAAANAAQGVSQDPSGLVDAMSNSGFF